MVSLNRNCSLILVAHVCSMQTTMSQSDAMADIINQHLNSPQEPMSRHNQWTVAPLFV